MTSNPPEVRIFADFNGLFGDLLCLSHADEEVDPDGTLVFFKPGMRVTAFEDDGGDDGRPEWLVATGVVERSPEWLGCKGSRWVLRIDAHGVRHEGGPPE